MDSKIIILIVVGIAIFCSFSSSILATGTVLYTSSNNTTNTTTESSETESDSTEPKPVETPTTSAPAQASSSVKPPQPQSVTKILSGCEADAANLNCPGSGIITSGTVKYGRWDNNVCPHATINSGVAAKEKIYPLPSNCMNKSSCTISNYNSTFGEDIYPNIYKQYEVNYKCTS